MRKFRFDKVIYRLKLNASCFFVENKGRILLLGIMFFIGIVLGICFSFNEKNIFILSGNSNFFIYIFSENYKNGTYFLLRFFSAFLNIAVISIFCLHKRMCFLHHAFFILKGFCFSFTLILVIKRFAFLGVLGVFLIFIPLQFIFLFGLLICSILGINFANDNFRFKTNNFLQLLLKFLIIFCIIMVSVLIDLIFINIFISPFTVVE